VLDETNRKSEEYKPLFLIMVEHVHALWNNGGVHFVEEDTFSMEELEQVRVELSKMK